MNSEVRDIDIRKKFNHECFKLMSKIRTTQHIERYNNILILLKYILENAHIFTNADAKNPFVKRIISMSNSYIDIVPTSKDTITICSEIRETSKKVKYKFDVIRGICVDDKIMQREKIYNKLVELLDDIDTSYKTNRNKKIILMLEYINDNTDSWIFKECKKVTSTAITSITKLANCASAKIGTSPDYLRIATLSDIIVRKLEKYQTK